MCYNTFIETHKHFGERMKKSKKLVVPKTTPRNPTVVPMLEMTKPARHKNKKRIQPDNKFYE